MPSSELQAATDGEPLAATWPPSRNVSNPVIGTGVRCQKRRCRDD